MFVALLGSDGDGDPWALYSGPGERPYCRQRGKYPTDFVDLARRQPPIVQETWLEVIEMHLSLRRQLRNPRIAPDRFELATLHAAESAADTLRKLLRGSDARTQGTGVGAPEGLSEDAEATTAGRGDVAADG